MRDCRKGGTDEDPIYNYDKMLDKFPLYIRFQRLNYPKFLKDMDLVNGLSLVYMLT